MTKPIRIIQYGLGAIGRAAARVVLNRESMQLVGAVDLDPQYAGRDLGDVLGLQKPLGFAVTAGLPDVQADAVIHCTGSSFSGVYEQLAGIAKAGLHCATSCEEALMPHYRNRALAAKLDRLCADHNVAMVGTGVNPGFVMDTLPVIMTAVSQKIRTIQVLRVVDAGTRRPALQRKVGAGLTRDEFKKLAEEEKIRHVGLTDSLVFIAQAIGARFDGVRETIEPVIGSDGRVAGVRQRAEGGGITLELEMYVGAPNPRDEIRIDGEPPLHVVVQGGTAGDVATPAILANVVPRLLEAKPGLHTMRTLALPHVAG